VQPPAEGRGPNPGTHTMLRSTLRLAAIGLIVLALGFGGGAAGAYLMLDGTSWTNPTPAATSSPAPAPAPAPQPERTGRWDLGTCLSDRLKPVKCAPGTWQLLAVVPNPGTKPCAGITSYPDTRYADGLALCLARY
ncbi:hypothetical protein ACFV1Y_20190, partial [Streptomyces werraensis]